MRNWGSNTRGFTLCRAHAWASHLNPLVLLFAMVVYICRSIIKLSAEPIDRLAVDMDHARESRATATLSADTQNQPASCDQVLVRSNAHPGCAYRPNICVC